ncbi:uncharacterized protein C8A04DRAFT_34536 [Dichotomopilus funicola]|uniref:rRNA-processing protein EFG1 n=1 Tax=Dichotomopilus funicola TaxID=1934379 RepID=A0AAN6V923_9PEZI|nr:hypothetical protein C8A04DRAFT_34536 [Dichotomopilus funicola]
MGTKRTHPPSTPYENPARKRLRTTSSSSSHQNQNPHHRRKQTPTAPIDLDSLTAIKKRARAIERLLARGGGSDGAGTLQLPATKQKDLERELAAHRQRIEGAREKKERSRMIGRYHMVRFFERKKALRFTKQLAKRLAQATDPAEVAQLQADLHVAQVDVDYAVYFPFMEPYISLYAGVTKEEKGKGEDDTEVNGNETSTAAQYLRTPRPAMWKVVEKTREQGKAALERLQNRRLVGESSAGDSAGGSAGGSAEGGVKTMRGKKVRSEEMGGQEMGSKEMPEKGGRRERRAREREERAKSGRGNQTKNEAERAEEDSDGEFFE